MIYSQECYPESTLSGYGPGDADPKNLGNDDRFIVNCGCCPTTEEEGLPGIIDKVTNVEKYDVCNGGIDCITEGFSPVDVSKSGTTAYVEVCVNGNVIKEENFFIPEEDDQVNCGPTCFEL